MSAITPRKAVPPRVLTDRTTADRFDAPRRHLERGDEVTIAGIRGRCAFVSYTRKDDGAEWVDVIHGKSGRSRVVRPDAIVTVHRDRTGILGGAA